MKRIIIGFLIALTVLPCFGQRDTVEVSIREHISRNVSYLALYANGELFDGDRDWFLKRLSSSSIKTIKQPKDESVVIFTTPGDTLDPYKVALHHIGQKFWEVILWAPYKPRMEKYATGIVYTYQQNDYLYRLVNTRSASPTGRIYSRWHQSITYDQSDY